MVKGSNGKILARNRMLRLVLLSVILLSFVGTDCAHVEQNHWPCGGHPKLLRNHKGEPLWLSSKKLSERVINRRDPILPSSVRLEGKIIVDVLIGTDGHVCCVRVRKGHPILRRALEEAVKQWTFKPILVKGEPVAVFGFLKFHFSN